LPGRPPARPGDRRPLPARRRRHRLRRRQPRPALHCPGALRRLRRRGVRADHPGRQGRGRGHARRRAGDRLVPPWRDEPGRRAAAPLLRRGDRGGAGPPPLAVGGGQVRDALARRGAAVRPAPLRAGLRPADDAALRGPGRPRGGDRRAAARLHRHPGLRGGAGGGRRRPARRAPHPPHPRAARRRARGGPHRAVPAGLHRALRGRPPLTRRGAGRMEPVIPASPPGGAEGPARPPLDLRAAALSAAFLALLVLPSASPWFAPALVAVAAATGALAPGLRYGAVPLLGGVLAAALALLWGEDSLRTVYNALTAGLACGALPWLLAGAWAGHRRSVAREWEALERAEEARRHGAEAARMREWNAVAEEHHDDLGHALSLDALNLGRLELSPDLGEEHREAVVRARREGGEAVERLGASVELLRGDAPSPAERSPAGVADLVANARSAGAGIDAEGEPAAE